MSVKVLRFLFVLFFMLSAKIFFAQDAALFLEEADKYTQSFEHEKSLITCQKADELFNQNWEVKWRLSRALVNVGMTLPTTTDEQEEKQFNMFQEALNQADTAVMLAPEQSICYLRRAVANGRIALFKGVFTVADVVEQVKLDCEKAIELNNGGDDVQAIAHYVLARTHAKISEKWAPARSVLGLGWADIDSALVEYERALKLKNDYPMFFFDYAEALIREDEYKKAKEMLNKCLKTKVKDINDHKRKEEAKELLKEVEEELED